MRNSIRILTVFSSFAFVLALAPFVWAAPGQGLALAGWTDLIPGQDGDGWGWGEGEDEPKPDEGGEKPPPPEQDGWAEQKKGTGGAVEVEDTGPIGQGKVTKFSISAWFMGVLPVGGEAGAGQEAPLWSDAYGFGFGGGAAGGYRLLPALELRVGLYYQSLGSKTFTALNVDNSLSGFSYLGVSVGGRFYFLMDRKTDQWFGPANKPYEGAAFFLGFDFGFGFSSPVSWDEPAPAWDYWDAGMILVSEFVGGVEYRFSPTMGAVLELGFGSNAAPPAADSVASPLNEAGSMTHFRFRVGILFAF